MHGGYLVDPPLRGPNADQGNPARTSRARWGRYQGMIGLADDMPKKNIRRMERAASFDILRPTGRNLSTRRHDHVCGNERSGLGSIFRLRERVQHLQGSGFRSVR
jgi:hypothetical protein